ncbi:hypothetical protein FDP41_003112 [Naegleria fowleri]|uniref:Uncharacterized protein n=1 Tax=Naegleria fowleri TaxID=5763 RepID=A0A6A5BVM6_NAEFO|nr:uncharacterized protein FDP41_003112 [Naegleria fowleri]KAF0977790.1 hypothetical protein FDP41_003112 [Naegleria fowleri]
MGWGWVALFCSLCLGLWTILLSQHSKSRTTTTTTTTSDTIVNNKTNNKISLIQIHQQQDQDFKEQQFQTQASPTTKDLLSRTSNDGDDQYLLCIEGASPTLSSASSSSTQLSQLVTATITPELAEYASNVLTRRPSYLENDVCGIRRDSYSTRTRSTSNHSYSKSKGYLTSTAVTLAATRVRASSWSHGMKIASSADTIYKHLSKEDILSNLVRYKFPSHE